MKYFNAFLSLALVAMVGSYFAVPAVKASANQFIYQSPCDVTTGYKIGTVDSRFNLTAEQLQSDINGATEVWGQVYGKELFAPNSTAKLTINLIFDERQGLSNQIGALENTLKSKQNDLGPEIAAYQQKIAAFQKKVADLNDQINYWNSKGGAPKDEYDKLIAQQQALKSEGDSLNAEAKRLNQSTNDFNLQVNNLNSQINQFNDTLTSKPEEGLYNPNTDTIDIYFDVDKNELIHTLAHELGHSLGMQHVENPQSIMYFRSNRIIHASEDDKAELARVCAKVPVWQLWENKAAEALREYLRNRQLQSSKSA